ncbi:hypothetical protein [Coleofasciculus sp. FACHB-501]|uniref:hypothetical protein n=1 Tax=Cyanophyceae TaxID=3028117 RepID=UPI00168642B1|nr:hypothetical protein [Coleofasciculus sp. FACHB-501]MBD1837395.1 hypothetical protein [Coleofasciculus sp. FACHB-501]
MAHDFFMLTLKALEHPQGLEVINAVREFRQEVQPELKPDPLLKVEAYNTAKSLGIRTPRHVNQMTNSELATWIEQHSV